MLKNRFRKGVSIVGSFALAMSLSTTAAFADTIDASDFIVPSNADLATNATTGAACRAAMPALEILGINSVEETGTFSTITSTNGGNYIASISDWSKPKYILSATTLNTSPSPFLAGAVNTALSTKAVYNPSRQGTGAGPNAALAAPGSDTTDDYVWAMKPDIVVGNAGSVDYENSYFSSDSTYNPKSVSYSCSHYSDLITTMNNIASQVEIGRYGSASSIAEQYAKYIQNTTAYVNANKTTTKKFVVVTGYEDGEYSVMTTDDADGTASSNRYFETASLVASNYGATAGGSMTRSDFSNVDLILVGGQNSSSNYSTIISALASDGLISKSYYVEDNGTQGAMYGVVMNSVENAQNIGRIFGCLYPDLIDQDAFIAYYYKNFYHIDDNYLASVIDNAMDGVRNWDASSTTSAADAALWSAVDISSLTAADWSKVNGIVSQGASYTDTEE